MTGLNSRQCLRAATHLMVLMCVSAPKRPQGGVREALVASSPDRRPQSRFNAIKLFIGEENPMPKKPKLKLVPATPSDSPEPPQNLTEHGLSLWAAVMSEYDLQDTGGREMLRQACSALDRAEACAEHIRRDGEVVHTRNGPKDHPLIKHELAARAFCVRTLHRLGLDVEPVRPVGRPAGSRP